MGTDIENVNLQTLITLRRGDRSLEQLARDGGDVPGQAQWSIYARTGPKRVLPDPPSIRAIARALRVSERTALHSCARSLGIDVSEHGAALLSLLPTGVSSLNRNQLIAVIAVVDVLVEANSASK